MSGETPEVQAVNPASEQEQTAAPVTENEVKPVVEETKETPPVKTFTQEELEAQLGKRLARERRNWEREQARQQAEVQAVRQTPANAPTQEQFESPEAYQEALIFQKAEQLANRRLEAEVKAHMLDSYHAREEAALDKYEDFEQVAYNPRVPITQVMAETIQSSEIGPDVAYYLGSNPKEADRISKLNPFLQAKEIGKIEAKIASDPPQKKTSTAPAPIQPVKGRSGDSPSFDTTDPRSVKTMSTSEWIAADRARQMKKLEAQRNR